MYRSLRYFLIVMTVIFPLSQPSYGSASNESADDPDAASLAAEIRALAKVTVDNEIVTISGRAMAFGDVPHYLATQGTDTLDEDEGLARVTTLVDFFTSEAVAQMVLTDTRFTDALVPLLTTKDEDSAQSRQHLMEVFLCANEYTQRRWAHVVLNFAPQDDEAPSAEQTAAFDLERDVLSHVRESLGAYRLAAAQSVADAVTQNFRERQTFLAAVKASKLNLDAATAQSEALQTEMTGIFIKMQRHQNAKAAVESDTWHGDHDDLLDSETVAALKARALSIGKEIQQEQTKVLAAHGSLQKQAQAARTHIALPVKPDKSE